MVRRFRLPGTVALFVKTTLDAVGGVDTITGGDGADVIMGGAKGDKISASLGGDIILGDAGQANLLGAIETVTTGEGGDDWLAGSEPAVSFSCDLITLEVPCWTVNVSVATRLLLTKMPKEPESIV